MSVVVFDGKTLAADRQACNVDLRFIYSKIVKEPNGTLLGFTGNVECGLAMIRWWRDGANPLTMPPSQDKDNWSRLIVVEQNASCYYYEQFGQPINMLGEYLAWGSGRDFALGALAMGADARKAVEVANQFCISCGMGVEAYDLE